MKVKGTYESLFTFWQVAQLWLMKNEGNPKTKLGWAIEKMKPRVEKMRQRYANKVEEIDVENCAVDDKGLILREPVPPTAPPGTVGELKYTKDGIKARNKQRQELFESTIELEAYHATKIPDDLTGYEKECFFPFVLKEIPPEPEETEEAEAPAVAEAASAIN